MASKLANFTETLSLCFVNVLKTTAMACMGALKSWMAYLSSWFWMFLLIFLVYMFFEYILLFGGYVKKCEAWEKFAQGIGCINSTL